MDLTKKEKANPHALHHKVKAEFHRRIAIAHQALGHKQIAEEHTRMAIHHDKMHDTFENDSE